MSPSGKSRDRLSRLRDPVIMRPFGSSVPAILEIRLHSRRFKLVTHLLLALALLVAQAGAQAHAYSHLQNSAAKSNFGAGQLCRDCLSFAPVASPGGTPQVVEFSVPVNTTEHTLCADVLPVGQAPVLHYRSRAPPILL